MFKHISVLVSLLILVGCDIDKLGSEFVDQIPDRKQPTIMLGSGIELQISETETAKIYGYDKCPANKMTEWLFGPTEEIDGCTMLSGNKTVSVILITNGERKDEVWTVTEGLGSSGRGMSITRPNGWSLREPRD